MLIRASRSGTKHAGISANIEIVSNTNTFLPRPVKISYTSDRTYSSNREQEQLYRNPFISFPPFAYLLSIAKLIADTDSTDTKIFATDESFARIWKILYAIVDPTKLKTLLSGKEKEREREKYIEIIGTSFEISRLYRLSKLLINLIFTRRNIYLWNNPILENEIGSGQSCSFRDNDR